MIDGDEDRGLPLAGHGRGQIGAPQLVDLLGPDRAIVGLGAVWPADAPRRLQRVAPES